MDDQYGAMLSKRFHHTKPPTIMDVPHNMQWAAVDIPDPETPGRARRAASANPRWAGRILLNSECSVGRALGTKYSSGAAGERRQPFWRRLRAGRPMQHPLKAHI